MDAQKLIRWRRDPLGGLYTSGDGDGSEWTIEQTSHEGMRGGRIKSWLVRHDNRPVHDTYSLNAAKQWVQQWVQAQRAGGHR